MKLTVWDQDMDGVEMTPEEFGKWLLQSAVDAVPFTQLPRRLCETCGTTMVIFELDHQTTHPTCG